MRLSFSSKVSLAVASLIVSSIAIYASVAITFEANRRIEEMMDEKKSLNEIMAFSIESAEVHTWTAYKKYIVKKAAEPEDVVYCRLVKRTGEIFLSNIEEERGMFISDPAIFTDETVVTHDVYDGETITTIVSPTYSSYTLWLGVSPKKIYAAINEMTVNTLITVLVVVAICTPVSYFIVSRSLNPLKKLTSLCSDISKGNFNVRSNIQSKDEIGTLSSTFDDMAGKLEKMREETRRSERLSAIGQLATMVGHDLRNPLSSIQNASYYLKMKLEASKDEKVRKMFEVIDSGVNCANNIIKDLLDFSRVKKPELKKVDLISSIQDALAQLKFPENVKITTKFSEVPTIEADPDQLRRVFQNIALNGIQAMPNGGELTVSARKNGDFVEVTFTDTGAGIPEENMDKLFTPLFTTKAQGVGLGLAICENLVEGHKGRIEVKSKVGEGSAFAVKLPIHQNKGGERWA